LRGVWHMDVNCINPHTGRPFVKDFFKKHARDKPCLVRIASTYGLNCAGRETTVLAHIALPGLRGIAKKTNDLLGAWACDTCHGIVDGRIKVLAEKNEISLYHLEGMARTIDELIRDGYLPQP